MVVVIDSIMGSGKTTYMIDHINRSYEERCVDGAYNPFADYPRYMFVTPFLKEVDRIKGACPKLDFRSPVTKGGAKLNHLDDLVRRGSNIAMTHALFYNVTDELSRLIADMGYTLILDEVIQCVEIDDTLTKSDKELISKSEMVLFDEVGNASWNEAKYAPYNGKFNKVRDLCRNNKLHRYGPNTYIKTMPLGYITSFKEVFIMTYMYKASVLSSCLAVEGVPVAMKTLIDGKLVAMNGKSHEQAIRRDLQGKIAIHDGPQNKYGKQEGNEQPFSKGWLRRCTPEMVRAIKASVGYYFKSVAKSKSFYNAWTTLKEAMVYFKGDGYAKGFITVNARATNEYGHKTALAYLANMFPNPILVQYLHKRGIEWDQDLYALSEMLQWIWRSAIRNGEPISIFIPSERMRNLLIDWLNDDLAIDQHEVVPQLLAA
ncbi:MAG: hypothetical protein P0Y66_02030 [Candidatus Kaistia colombiensis]|nr:MAG: hypothetical protein P0Y66_02030 [Kaistia sp.]